MGKNLQNDPKNELDIQLKKLENKKKKVNDEYKNLIFQQKRADNKQKRKERTHRIATKGALLEKYFNCSEYDFDDTEKLLKMFSDYVNENKTNYFKEKYHNDE